MDIYVLAKIAGTTTEDGQMELTFNAIGTYTTEDKAKRTLAVVREQLLKEYQYGRLKSTSIEQDTGAKFSISNTRRGTITTIKVQKIKLED